MKILRLSDLRKLAEPKDGVLLSLCMPTYVTGNDRWQDSVRLKVLTDRAARQMVGLGLSNTEVRHRLTPVTGLLDDENFWKHRGSGLALYMDRSSMQEYCVPVHLEELVVVSDRYHIKPLLPLFNFGAHFFVLALSQHQVRLFEATDFQVEELDTALPQRLEETLNLQAADRGSQTHFAMHGGKGKQTSVFHGQGGEKDTHKEELTLFFREIDEALEPVLQIESAPLILAGVDYLLPLFRDASRYPHIAIQEIEGNCDHLSAGDLYKKAWPLALPMFTQKQEEAAERYHNLLYSGKAIDDLKQVLQAAHQGRIETLFVVANRYSWGLLNPDGRIKEMHGEQQLGDCDLLDVASSQTLLHGGKIYAIEQAEMPTNKSLAAILRF